MRRCATWRVASALSTSAPPPLMPWNKDVSLSAAASRTSAGLPYILQRIQLHMVPFNAQDLYQICGTIYHNDNLGILANEEVMRALLASFERSDQRVLSPFQVTLILDTFRKAGLNSTAKEITVPEEDAVSAESLLNALRGMRAAKTRDEKKMSLIGQRAMAIVDEFTLTQLSETLTELSKLQFSDALVVNGLARRLLTFEEDVGPLEASALMRAVASCKGLSPFVMRHITSLVEQHLPEFQMEDYQNVLYALLLQGDSHGKTFAKLVEAGLEEVEGMDASTLALFLQCFAALRYPVRAHVEIYADALVDVATDLSEREVVHAFVALHQLKLLTEDLFTSMLAPLIRYAPTMNQSHLAPVMDVCSATHFSSETLMQPLLGRVGECLRILTPNQLADVLDILGLYPPARQQADFVQMTGQQARIRMEIMAPEAVSRVTRGLAHLGYRDAEFYLFAAETGFRFGFTSWHALEPVVMGVALSPDACSLMTVKRLASYAAPLCRSMTLQEVQRANHYFMVLRCEEEYLYRALASRTLQFVKQVTADTPEELRVLLQRAAVTAAPRPAR